MSRPLRDGEPCEHPGCLQHIGHPCEGCGRTMGISVYESRHTDPISPLKIKTLLGPSTINPNLEIFDVQGHWEGNTFVLDIE
jgi:hypothetical protein